MTFCALGDRGQRDVRGCQAGPEQLERLVGSLGKPALNPLPLRLEELARSIAIDLDAGSGALPIRLHGSGSRSLASLQVQSVLYDRRLRADGKVTRPQPITLVEEPEAHLHPQATFDLATLLEATRGQVTGTLPHDRLAMRPHLRSCLKRLS
jgi:hypothetical protein